jgi:hypothetical protein
LFSCFLDVIAVFGSPDSGTWVLSGILPGESPVIWFVVDLWGTGPPIFKDLEAWLLGLGISPLNFNQNRLGSVAMILSEVSFRMKTENA